MTSCGKKDDGTATITLRVPATITLRVQKADSSAALNLATNSVNGSESLVTAAGNKSFTPDAFKLWINTIVLQNDEGGSNQFYMCDTSATDCEVDFASTTSVAAFEAKLNAIEITAGTYNKVWISCNPNSAGYIKYKGRVTVSGTTNYTADPNTNSGSPLTTDSTKNSEITLANVGCGLTMHLPQAVTIADGDSALMTTFSNLHGIAYYAANASGGMGGCKRLRQGR